MDNINRLFLTLHIAFILMFVCVFCSPLNGQKKVSTITISGSVIDKDNLESVSFATVQFAESELGQITDEKGTFNFTIPRPAQTDTLKITYVGYDPYIIVVTPSDSFNHLAHLKIMLDKTAYKKEVFIKSKFTKSYLLWRKIVRRKHINNYNNFRHYSYNVHNRLEIGLNDFDKNKLDSSRLLKPFRFLSQSIDTNEFGTLTLPIYISESLSDYFYQTNPLRKREIIKGIISHGVENESILNLLGQGYSDVNFYNDNLTIFDKTFLSPFAVNGDNFYNFKILDTQYINKMRYIHFLFVPKFFAENTFEGDCWVRDTFYAIQKINLRLRKDANINYIKKANYMMEFQPINDSLYFIKKINGVAEMRVGDKRKIEFLTRKTTTYKNVNFDTTVIQREVAKNKAIEEFHIAEGATEQKPEYWNDNRHEPLKKSELIAHATMDTFLKMPIVLRIINTVRLLSTGYIDYKMLRIGKWWSVFSGNPYITNRYRIDLANNQELSKNFNIQGFLTLNNVRKDTTEKQPEFNAGVGVKYIFDHRFWSEVGIKWSKDLDLGSYNNTHNLWASDNRFVSLLKRDNLQFKIAKIEELTLNFIKRFPSNLGFEVKSNYQKFTPILGFHSVNDKNLINEEEYINSNMSLKLRYAYLESFIENNYEPFTFGAKAPIISLDFTKGFSGIGRSEFDYTKIQLQCTHYLKREPWGNLTYDISVGKIWGTLPLFLLERPNPNLTTYYKDGLFNTVRPYQFIMDQYAKLFVYHNLGSGIFRFIPYVKKWRLRQFWSMNAMAGSVSKNNADYNNSKASAHFYKDLSSTPLIELGTGIDNILNVFRVSYFWRVSPKPLPEENYATRTFMISFHLQL